MKRTLTALAITVVANSAQAWETLHGTDPMTDAEVVLSHVASDNMTGYPPTPNFDIQFGCDGRNISGFALVVYNDQASMEIVDGGVFEIRFDKRPAFFESGGGNSDAIIITADETVIDLAKKFYDATTVTVRINRVTDTFDVSGSRDALKPVAEKCDWPNEMVED